MVLNLNELLMQRAIPHCDDRDEASGEWGVLRGCWAKIEVETLIGTVMQSQLSNYYSLEIISLSLSFFICEKKREYLKSFEIQ